MGFVLVCYYTIGSVYEAPAKALENKAKERGVKCHVRGISDRGGWCENTDFKPVFISECMRDFNDDIAYTDADSVMHAYPSLFDSPAADIIIRKQDFRWRKGEWMSGTFFMRNCETNARVVEEWASRVSASKTTRNNPRTWEQHHLGSAIESCGASWSQLPAEYICFDHIEQEVGKIANPVFTHMQYSRKTAARR